MLQHHLATTLDFECAAALTRKVLTQKIGPSTGIPTCVKSTFHVHKSHLKLYKNVLCTLVYIMYMVPSEKHGAPQNHNKNL